jgi:hypothetical protein
MNQETLRLLCRQLAHWAETAILQGRLPFRKVEVFPEILTPGGPLAPPLVFWINRDSFMAGGFILFPPKDADQDLETGCHCAHALGLRHFVAWAPRELVIWEIRQQAVLRFKTIPLSASGNESAEGFQETLHSVMEELKLLSVLGAVPPDQLSAHYLANLCLSTLQDSAPFLVEACQVRQGEEQNRTPSLTPKVMADSKGTLTLCRLIALVLQDRLPPTVQPEGLERAMHFALDTLQDDLRLALWPATEEVPLPMESAVRFHHLFRRLSQLRLDKIPERGADVLKLLLKHQGLLLGGATPPETDDSGTGSVLTLNATHSFPQTGSLIEVAPVAILAYTALLRFLANRSPAQAIAGDIFSLGTVDHPARIYGTLLTSRIPSSSERRTLTAHLRRSWPSRRFLLPSGTPLWGYELLYLLGLAAEGCRIDLHTPDWLCADFRIPLLEVLGEQFTLKLLARRPDGGLHIRLDKMPPSEALTTLIGPAETRTISGHAAQGSHPAIYPLTLDLPAELLSLIDEGDLIIPTNATWPTPWEREVFLYSRSSLGRLLWQIVGGGQPLPRRAFLKESSLQQGLPLPVTETLKNLRLLAWSDGDPLPTTATLDIELALWLGTDPLLRPVPRQAVKPNFAAASSTRPEVAGDLAEELIREVFVDGLPRFPEQYLYDHYRPRLQEFTVAGPLVIGDEFFERLTLYDPQGKTVEVEGMETARALVLASCDGRTHIALPCDRQLTAEILDRYLVDLRKLRSTLVQQAHRRISEPRSAAAMVKRVWASLPLPRWDMVTR